jgi:hypothetical protein
MKNGIVIIISALFFSLISQACDSSGKTGIAPDNSLNITVDSLISNGMTEEKFNSIIARVEKIYAPVARQKHGHLQIVKDWNDGTVNAYAKQTFWTWQIKMFGGLARHPMITSDGFMLVVCHELAHHIGGLPRVGWAAVEGQADYFGTMKCLRRVLEKDDNQTIISSMSIDTEATTKCQQAYKNQNEIALCQRISMAGKSVAMLLGDIAGNSNVSFSTPDKTEIINTSPYHPAAQCRLDTFFQGILCDKSWDQDVSNDNSITGACTDRSGDALGARPLCWYKPAAGEHFN